MVAHQSTKAWRPRSPTFKAVSHNLAQDTLALLNLTNEGSSLCAPLQWLFVVHSPDVILHLLLHDRSPSNMFCTPPHKPFLALYTPLPDRRKIYCHTLTPLFSYTDILVLALSTPCRRQLSFKNPALHWLHPNNQRSSSIGVMLWPLPEKSPPSLLLSLATFKHSGVANKDLPSTNTLLTCPCLQTIHC